jgi:hypothetical protein
MIRQLEQCLGNPTFERKEASGCNHLVSVAHEFSEKPDQRFVELRMFVCESFERCLVEKAHCRITHRHYRRRARQAIEDRKFTDDGAPAEEGKNALGARVRNYRNLEKPFLNAVTAVAGIAGPEQHLTGTKPH